MSDALGIRISEIFLSLKDFCMSLHKQRAYKMLPSGEFIKLKIEQKQEPG